jgi:pantetheine-phosphate adenylyltransferase
MKETIAIYPGSFDPLTNGHLDIIRRASKLFDRLIVTVSTNSAKQTLFTHEERSALVTEACADLPNISVASFSGLLMNFVKQSGAGTIIRGLRAVTDFEYEFAMALMNKHLADDVETVFLATSEGYSFVSSSMVKEVFQLGGNVDDKVPPCVLEALREKYSSGKMEQ